MRWAPLWATGVVAALGVAGCGPNCQETCFRVYAETECGRQPGGVGAEELIKQCTTNCQNALLEVGPMGGYDPDARQVNGFALQNETQAAAWMDCIADSTCQELNPALINPDLGSSSSCFPL